MIGYTLRRSWQDSSTGYSCKSQEVQSINGHKSKSTQMEACWIVAHCTFTAGVTLRLAFRIGDKVGHRSVVASVILPGGS